MSIDTYGIPFEDYVFSVIVDLLNLDNNKIIPIVIDEKFSELDFISRFPWLLESPSKSTITLTKINRNTLKNVWGKCDEVQVFLGKDNILKAKTKDGFYIFGGFNPQQILCMLYVKDKSMFIIPTKHAARIEECFRNRMSHKNVFDIITFDG